MPSGEERTVKHGAPSSDISHSGIRQGMGVPQEMLTLAGAEPASLDLTTLSIQLEATPPSDGAGPTLAGAEGGEDPLRYLAPPLGPGELGRLGPYRVLKVVGFRGLGVVFQAEDPTLKRPVALKALRPSMAVSSRARERFIREAQLTAGLEHDHIVEIHEAGEDRGVLFLAMQLLQGEPLEQRLQREGKLPSEQVIRIAREIATGLAAAHERGLVHRDINPDTIWLEADRGRVKILDFGLARALDQDSHQSHSGTIPGMAHYMAPEQAEGDEVGPSADLFSLGSVMYHMATGLRPFAGSTNLEVLRALAVTTPAHPCQVNAALPRPLGELIVALLARRPADRPGSARLVVEELRGIEAADDAANTLELARRSSGRGFRQPAPSGAGSPGAAIAQPTARHGARLAAGILFVALAAGAVLLLPLLQTGPDRSPPDDGPSAEDKKPWPADGLRRNQIPPAILEAAGGDSVPAEIVAIFGHSGLRGPVDTLTHPLMPNLPLFRDVAISRDGNLIATAGLEAGRDGGSADLRLWNAKTGELVRHLSGHDAGIAGVAFSPDGKLLASVDLDHLGKVWSTADGELVSELVWHKGPIRGVAFSPDGKWVATASADKTVRLWDPASGIEQGKPLVHDAAVHGVIFHPDGKRLLTADAFGKIRIWDTAKGEVLKVWTAHLGIIHALAFDTGGNRLASGGQDGAVKIWDADNGIEITTLRGHDDAVRSLAFSLDGRFLAAAGGKNHVTKIWLTSDWSEVLTLRGHTATVNRTLYTPDGRLISASSDRSIALWDPTPTALHLAGPTHFGAVTSAAISPNGEILASAGSDRYVRLWDLGAGSHLRVLSGHTAAVRQVAFSSRGRLASASADGTVRLWNTDDPDKTTILKAHKGSVTAIAFSVDGQMLASAGSDRAIKVWQVDGGSVLHHLDGTQEVLSLAFDPDGTVLAAGGRGRSIQLWSLAAEKVRSTLVGHTDAVSAVIYRSDGKQMMSAGADRVLRLWNPLRDKETRELTGHTRAITAAALRRDAKVLASVADDGTLRLWHLAAEQPGPDVFRIFQPGIRPSAVVFSPEGRHVVTANSDGTLYVVRLGNLPQ